MYEPKYLPQLSGNLSPIFNIRFSAVRFNEYRAYDDSTGDSFHIHNYLEIFINASNDVSFFVNNNIYSVPNGDAVVTRSGDIHMGIFNTPAVHEHICIWIDSDLTDPLFSFLNEEDFCPLFSFDGQAQKQLRTLALSLSDMHGKSDSELEQAVCLLEILTILKKKTLHSTEQAHIPEPLRCVLNDIHANFAEIRTVGDILNSHFVSSATLTRWFRKYLCTSPREYLESVKLSNATSLLANGYSVTQACMRSGFSDCSHFIALFKKKFGETPLRYKKRIAERR